MSVRPINLLIIGRLFVAAIFAYFAGYLCINNINGWGWMIFASLVLGCFDISVKSNEQ